MIFNELLYKKTLAIFKPIKIIILLLLACFSFFEKALGQSIPIYGNVKDRSGVPLHGATVINLDQQLDNSTKTDVKGNFSIQGDKGDLLKISYIGYEEQKILYHTAARLQITLSKKSQTLETINVEASGKKKIDPTKQIDLTNRSYMNLAQVLQGTVPGLTLEVVSSTKRKVSGVNVVTRNSILGTKDPVFYTVEEFVKTQRRGQEIINALSSGNIPFWLKGSVNLYSLVYSSSFDNSLVPRMRGSNNFNADFSNMLIVIDGFPQEKFPSDYPMNNVESIEVVKNPAELTKWGPKASGGLILIKTNGAKAGNIQLNYSSNFYYAGAPKFNRSKMQLATSADLLDYMKDAYDAGQISKYNPDGLDLSAAESLLMKLDRRVFTKEIFDQKWDSLKMLSNEQQFRLLQQNAFSQNHMLTASGGTKLYRFNASGNYANNRSDTFGDNEQTLGVNLNNDLSLLKNKLQVKLSVQLNGAKQKAGVSIDPRDLEPYQMILDNHNNYVYDYSEFNPDANQRLEKAGFKNMGLNLLEDARLNNNQTKTLNAQTRLNTEWQILSGLSWINSLQYNLRNMKTENLLDAASSSARLLINQNSSLTPTGIDYYIPPGDIMYASKNTQRDWNIRSALSYSKSFKKHNLNFSLGGGGFSNSFERPPLQRMYGYTKEIKSGSTVFLPTPDPMAAISNYNVLLPGLGSSAYPHNLIAPQPGSSTISRGLNWNGFAGYTFDNSISLSGNYNTVLNPDYGTNNIYSAISIYGLNASWNVKLKLPKWMSEVKLSSGISGNKVPIVPAVISSIRTIQPVWNNYGIWANSFTPSQQRGQSSRNFNQGLTLGFLENQYVIGVAYNTQRMNGIPRTSNAGNLTKSDSTAIIGYLSANLQMNLRKNLFQLKLDYSRSPEGQEQINGNLMYDVAKESYFSSKTISTLLIEGSIQNISPNQGIGIMMGTNAPSGAGFSQATNTNFNVLPPKNVNIEVHTALGIADDRFLFDFRYYDRTTSGLNNNVSLPTDPSTGLATQLTYSNIQNRGLEFFLRNSVIKKSKFSYDLTINGAYNQNIAKSVPKTEFSGNSNYTRAYRNGYSTDNIWSYRWAGLDNQGSPQIYNASGVIVSKPDTTTLTNALVYSGLSRPPLTGGLIQEWRLGSFFSRASVVFSWGHVMRTYIPVPSGELDYSSLIKDRWKKPGDEAFTDVPGFDGAMGTTTAVRSFIARNSSNTIVSANHLRLQEVMIGWSVPKSILGKGAIKSFTITCQVQNVAFWAQNKLGIDPTLVSDNGNIGLSLPKQYSCSINASF